MTTIIASVSQQSMASDSWGTIEPLPFALIKKIYRLKNGELLGFAGDVDNAYCFIDWCNKGFDLKNKPTFNEDRMIALILKKTHITLYTKSFIPLRLHNDFYAIGTGADAATAAMICGKSLKDSIEVACKVDYAYSGLPAVVKKL